MSVTRLFAALPFFMLPVAPAWANAIDIQTTVTAATVYADRATVTRTGSAPIPAGDQVVTITGLPAGLMPDSLRATGTATAGVAMGAVEYKIVNAAELSAPRERELQGKLQDLQDGRALIVAEQTGLQSRLTFLDKIGNTVTDRVNENIQQSITLKPDEWAASAIKMGQVRTDTQKALQAVTVQLRQLDAQIAAVQNDLNAIQTGGQQTYTVTIPLKVAAATTVNLALEYQIGNASWQPLYDARLMTDNASVELTQFAEVRQATGEEWDNVLLTLSTAQPARGNTPPALATWWVNLFDPGAGYGARTMSAGAAYEKMARSAELESTADMAVASAPALATPEIQMAMTGAQIETGGYVAQYKIPGRVRVAADNSAQKVMIQSLKSTATLVADVRPALDPQAYVVAKVKLAGETPLLSGRVNLFRDHAFIGQTYQALLRPGEETRLPFGVDDQIVVKRQIKDDKRGESGIVSAQTTLDRVMETEIQNLHTFPVALEVFETVPTPQNERIKVTVNDKVTTQGAVKDALNTTGLYQWTTTLQPQAKHKVSLGYTVAWPKGQDLTGI